MNFRILMTAIIVFGTVGDTFDGTWRNSGSWSTDNEANKAGYTELGAYVTDPGIIVFCTVPVELKFHLLWGEDDLNTPITIVQEVQRSTYIEWVEDSELALLEDEESGFGATNGFEPDVPNSIYLDNTLSDPGKNIYFVDAPGFSPINLYDAPLVNIPFFLGDKIHYKANFKTWIKGGSSTNYTELIEWRVWLIVKLIEGPNYDEDPDDLDLQVIQVSRSTSHWSSIPFQP